MGKYGRDMRDCCDSPASHGAPHILGCPKAMVEPLDTKAWVMVPVEPTEEMVDAGGRQQARGRGGPDSIYRAMLSASPSLPVVDGGEVVATSWKYHDRACVDFKFSPDPYALERGFLTDIEPLVRQSALLAAESRVQYLEEALRRIAEGNLGGDPWQANYDRIRQVAQAALSLSGEKP